MCEHKLDPATRDRLTRGEILIETEDVPGSSIPKAFVRAMIPAPPERVWEIVDRVSNFQNTMMGVKRSEELSREGNVVRARLTVGVPFPLKDLTSVTTAVHEASPPDKWQRAWDLESGDYEANNGRWTLYPFDGDSSRTLAVYVLHAEPKMRVPGAIKKFAAAKAIPRLIEHLRKQVR